MTKRFFVTGTDTEVGKTVASSALLQAANQLGFNTAGYKPVASGGGGQARLYQPCDAYRPGGATGGAAAGGLDRQ